jgi:hypothetical protein
VYTYTSSVELIYEIIYGYSNILFPANPYLPGFFAVSRYTPVEYITFESGQVTGTAVENFPDDYDSVLWHEFDRIIVNQQLYSEYENSDQISYAPNTEREIQRVIYGW